MLLNNIRHCLCQQKPDGASPGGKHKAIAFEVFSPRLLTRRPAGGVWIISFLKIIVIIMHKPAAH
jgi:hypothetical protein